MAFSFAKLTDPRVAFIFGASKMAQLWDVIVHLEYWLSQQYVPP